VAGGRRRLYNEEFHKLYASPNIIRVMKWSRMRWTRCTAHMGEVINAYKLLVSNPEGMRLGQPGVTRKIILECGSWRN
jgi:hypothetical protein